MQLIQFILFTLLLNNVVHYSDTEPVTIQLFEQRLDHFNPFNNQTWNQRYMMYDKFRNTTRNIAFILVGGESGIDGGSIESSFLMDYAKHFQAIVFNLEHRFYGKSHPTVDLSVKSLRHLSSQQALADLAYFIKAMNKEYNLTKNVKWIAFGGSYSATLAVWLRLLYPHFVQGVVAIGAPLLAKMNHEEGVGMLADLIRNHSEKCATAVKDGADQVESLLKSQKGREEMYNLFKLCTRFVDDQNTGYDIALLFLKLYDNFRFLGDDINFMCKIMTNESFGSELKRYAKVNEMVLELTKQQCLLYDFQMIMDYFRNPQWEINNVTRSNKQWSYQLCTEFGFFQTSDHKPQIFGNKFPLDFYVTKCQHAFSARFDHDFIQRAVDKTNFFYGGKDIQVTNVVYIYGSCDSWKTLGVTETTNKGSSVIIIDGYGHDAGIRALRENETRSSAVREALAKTQEWIHYWLTI